MHARSSGRLFSVLQRNLSNSSKDINQVPFFARCSSTYSNRPPIGERRKEGQSEGFFPRNAKFGSKNGENVEKVDWKPASPIPGRPLRGEGGMEGVQEDHFADVSSKQHRVSRERSNRATLTGEGRGGSHQSLLKLKPDDGNHEGFDFSSKDTVFRTDRHKAGRNSEATVNNGVQEEGNDRIGESLFQKLKLGELSGGGRAGKKIQMTDSTTAQLPDPESPVEDADQIFKKMKETGMIPNAVAMLDGLCKDGLVQEAMKLFGLMREKGTIPEVVIYTAVVEGFCKATKFDDAKRIFRKMQKNGIVPNAFSYSVLIQGLCKGKRVEDAFEFSFEMVDAGHTLNGATFTSIVDVTCKEQGTKEAQDLVRKLRERGYALDEKAIRDHLDKKGPYSPMVWEAIFGKKNSQRPF